MHKLILYVDIDAFFASVEQNLNPALRGKPVMVGGFPHEMGVVACPSYEARALGVETGMLLSEAHRRAPKGIFLKGDYSRYKDTSDRFQRLLLSFSPLVEMISQDEAVVDLTGSARDYDSGAELVRTLKQRVRSELGVTISAGLAQNRFLAKVASEHRKPDGLIVVPAGKEWEFLEQLSIRNVPGVGPKSRRILADKGIRTIGQLRQIPQAYLQKLFGQRGFKMAEYLLNRDPRLLEPLHLLRRISRETGFFTDVTDLRFIHATLYYLLERACIKLRENCKKCNQLTVKLRYTTESPVSTGRTLPGYVNTEEQLFPQALTLLAQLHTRRLAINQVGIALSGIVDAPAQGELFDAFRDKHVSLTAAMDKLRTSFGYHALCFGKTLSLRDNYRQIKTGYELRTPSLSQ